MLQRRKTGCDTVRRVATPSDRLQRRATVCDVVQRARTRSDAVQRVEARRGVSQRRATDCNTARRVATQYSTYRASERAGASACASQRRARALAQGSQASAATYPYNPRISNGAGRAPEQRLCGFGCNTQHAAHNTHRCSVGHAHDGSMQHATCSMHRATWKIASRNAQHAQRSMRGATCSVLGACSRSGMRALSCTCTRSPASFGFVATAPMASAAPVAADDVARQAPSRACAPGGSG